MKFLKQAHRLAAAAAIAATGLLASPLALSHGGAAPQYGGVVQTASDLSFELVTSGDSTLIYVIDHGKPYDTAGTSGKLTALTGTQKSEAELKPAGGNKLEASGLKLSKGAKTVAVIQTRDKKSITVRFTVK